jgi:hypothetical protein
MEKETFAITPALVSVKKLSKKDMPRLKPITQLKRGRKKKPIIQAIRVDEQVTLSFD